MSARFHVRDDWDGTWAEFDTREEAEAALAEVAAANPTFEFRVDDMED